MKWETYEKKNKKKSGIGLITSYSLKGIIEISPSNK